MVKYAFDGIVRYLEDGMDDYDDRATFALDIEFREGFECYRPEFLPMAGVFMDLIQLL